MESDSSAAEIFSLRRSHAHTTAPSTYGLNERKRTTFCVVHVFLFCVLHPVVCFVMHVVVSDVQMKKMGFLLFETRNLSIISAVMTR